MGKFIPEKVREYTFVSVEEFICDVMNDFNEMCNSTEDIIDSIGITVTSDEAREIIPAFLSTGKFSPEVLDFDYIDYEGEYHISLCSDGGFWVSKAWSDTCNRYIEICGDRVSFISQSIPRKCYDAITENTDNCIVLYNIAY